MKRAQLALLFSLLVSTTFLWSSCSKTLDNGDPVISVRGKVFDQQSREPLDSAWVSLGDSNQISRVYTDTSGSFGTATVPFESQILYVGKDRYLTFDTLLENVTTSIGQIHIELRSAH